MKSELFWDFICFRKGVCYWCFGKTYWSHLLGRHNPWRWD